MKKNEIILPGNIQKESQTGLKGQLLQSLVLSFIQMRVQLIFCVSCIFELRERNRDE